MSAREKLIAAGLARRRPGEQFDIRHASPIMLGCIIDGHDLPMNLVVTTEIVKKTGSDSLGWADMHKGPLEIHTAPGDHVSPLPEIFAGEVHRTGLGKSFRQIGRAAAQGRCRAVDAMSVEAPEARHPVMIGLLEQSPVAVLITRGLAHAAPTGDQSDTTPSETMLIGGIPTLRANRQQLAARMVADCALARSGQMATPRVLTSSNGSVIAKCRRDAAFRDLIMKADAVDADGQPLVIASWLFSKTPLTERVATTDFIHDAANAAAANGLRFYFLGAKPGVAKIAADHLRGLHPGLQIVGVRDGYFRPDQEDQICRGIVGLEADVLWVGLGSPAQESFALRNREKLAGLAWIKTCGGLFDHYSGQFSRAPMWMQKAGLEWLHRVIQEPRRLGPRYLITNLPALYQLITVTSDGPVPPTPGAVPV